MTLSFFCDTGVIHGLCKGKDYHNKSCKLFLNKYPINNYDYFVPKIVISELDHQKKVLNQKANNLNPYEVSIARTFQRCVNAFLRDATTFHAQNHGIAHSKSLKNLIIELQKVIKITKRNQINDVEIVAQAVMWSLLTVYGSHNLLTVDKKDIVNRKKRILHISTKSLKTTVNLDIVYVPYVNP